MALNRKEIKKSSSVRDVMRQNYLRKIPQVANYKEKTLQTQIKTLNNQISSQKDLLSIKESQYREIVAKREDLKAAISKFVSNTKYSALNDNKQGFNTLEYLYQSYILEIDNMENDFLRKQGLGELRTKDIKIQKLVEQLKIRDEYISEEKKQLAKKKIKYFFKGENEIKKLEELNIDKNFCLPFIIQQENNSFNQNDNKFRSLDNSKLCHAEAKIFAKIKNTINEEIYLEQLNETKINKKVKRKSFMFFNLNIPLSFAPIPKGNYKREFKVKNLVLFKKTLKAAP